MWSGRGKDVVKVRLTEEAPDFLLLCQLRPPMAPPMVAGRSPPRPKPPIVAPIGPLTWAPGSPP